MRLPRAHLAELITRYPFGKVTPPVRNPNQSPGPMLRHVVPDLTDAPELFAFFRSNPQATIVSEWFPDDVALTVQFKLDMHFVVRVEHSTNASDLHSRTAADESGHSLRRQEDVQDLERPFFADVVVLRIGLHAPKECIPQSRGSSRRAKIEAERKGRMILSAD